MRGESPADELMSAAINRSPLFPSRCVFPNKRKSAFQFGSKIGGFGRDPNGLASGFPTQPAVQFVGRGLHAASVVSNGHPGFCPPLCH
jgi:hypothetical protein